MNSQKTTLSELTAISSLDGRYRSKVEELAPIVSEYGLIKNRIEIEIKYLIALSNADIAKKFMTTEQVNQLEDLIKSGSIDEMIKEVKDHEMETRHDVKAVEKMLRIRLKSFLTKSQLEMIHFGLTSEDINNLAYRLQLHQATHQILLPIMNKLIDSILEISDKFKSVPMLARTHGQPAVPTTLGKEFSTFAIRINTQVIKLKRQKLTGKLNGAVGNFNALQLAYPDIDWLSFSDKFVSSLGLTPNLFTTQINPYDDVVEFLQIYQRLNSILIGFDQDLWRYISDEWFVQEIIHGEVGSSTMPQKVNPIDFENSEGNLGLANSLIEFFSRKLLISRLQRDLSDSTTVRNYGAILGYSLVGYKSTLSGISRIKPNTEKLAENLNKDWSILSEGLQTILRKFEDNDPYSKVSSIIRGSHTDEKNWKAWMEKLQINQEAKTILLNLTPENYIGLAVELTERAIAEIKTSRKDK